MMSTLKLLLTLRFPHTDSAAMAVKVVPPRVYYTPGTLPHWVSHRTLDLIVPKSVRAPVGVGIPSPPPGEGKVVIRPIAFKPVTGSMSPSTRFSNTGERYGSTPILTRPGSHLTLGLVFFRYYDDNGLVFFRYYDDNGLVFFRYYDDNGLVFFRYYDDNGLVFFRYYDDNGLVFFRYYDDNGLVFFRYYDDNGLVFFRYYDDNGLVFFRYYDDNGLVFFRYYDDNGLVFFRYYDDNGLVFFRYYDDNGLVFFRYYDDNGLVFFRYYDDNGLVFFRYYDDNGLVFFRYYDDNGLVFFRYYDDNGLVFFRYYDDNGLGVFRYYDDNCIGTHTGKGEKKMLPLENLTLRHYSPCNVNRLIFGGSSDLRHHTGSACNYSLDRKYLSTSPPLAMASLTSLPVTSSGGGRKLGGYAGTDNVRESPASTASMRTRNHVNRNALTGANKSRVFAGERWTAASSRMVRCMRSFLASH
uniref:Uncharacterized protein n=1 Tax=Timema poppense TaxID=170557 RepID=A0A7R9CQE5_TIMPO|nr:unnamed protein product [Timema poppensis]